jgi:hypothetical protein
MLDGLGRTQGSKIPRQTIPFIVPTGMLARMCSTYLLRTCLDLPSQPQIEPDSGVELNQAYPIPHPPNSVD